eukprot:8347762-Ditylum_brightwellii.AAC.1
MLEYNMGYMGLIEINLDTMNHDVQKRITEETKKRINQISVQLTSSNIPMENFYKPDGVLSICQGDFLSQKITESKDSMGRWVYSKFAASDKGVITVVTAYQPCKQSKIMGTTTYHQQVVMPKQQKCSIDPRTAFITDLWHWLLECSKCGEKLILGGDFNERITPKATLMKILSDPIL